MQKEKKITKNLKGYNYSYEKFDIFASNLVFSSFFVFVF